MGLPIPKPSRKVILAAYTITLLLYLVGFGVGMDHEGGVSTLRVADVLCLIMSAIAYVMGLFF